MAAKGTGVTKHKDGRFMARYTVHTPDGPRPLATPSASAAPSPQSSASTSGEASAEAQAGGYSDPAYKAQNPGECEPTGYNPVSDSGDNYSQGVVVGDDTPDSSLLRWQPTLPTGP
jgi:hypothetical protein